MEQKMTDNVIVEIQIPVATEITVKYPDGDILAFTTKKNHIGANILVMIVLTTTDAKLVTKDLYLLNSGDKMRKIDSLGKYYGSVQVHDRLLHIFRQNYKEPEVLKTIDPEMLENKYWAI